MEKTKKDQKICSKLEKNPFFKKAKNILFYASIKEEGEVDTWRLIKKYIQIKNLFFPRVQSNSKILEICQIKNTSQLQAGYKKILEPHGDCKKIAPKKIDLVIVPGLAFDKQGNRIGYGDGFYDRLLKKMKCPAIALAYEFQIVQSVPGEKHDVKIDQIITEKKSIKISKKHLSQRFDNIQ